MNRKERTFVAKVWEYYRTQGRHDLPWRKNYHPYRVLVSEMMLQQTQVERVIPKYNAFLKQFPSAAQLAKADLKSVLIAWQGLGYNRRAKFLWQTAQAVQEKYSGTFPEDMISLQTLPGIGSYTAAAILNFAFNQPVPLIETNVRTVYIHHFFRNQTDVADSDIVRLVERTLDKEHPREWFAALMDYGAYLKRTEGNLSRLSKHYAKQPAFAGSSRYIRGRILKLLTEDACTEAQLLERLIDVDTDRVQVQLTKLVAEGLIQKKQQRYSL